MNNRRNSIWNLSEAIVNGLVVFLAFKAVLERLGVEAVGIWSLVTAATALARAADVGASGALARFTAMSTQPDSTGGAPSRRAYFGTALAINAVLYGALGLLMYFPLAHLLGRQGSGALRAESIALLPFGIASFVALNIAVTGMAALVGYGRSDIKSASTIAGAAVYLATVVLLLPHLGLRAAAVGQIGQNVVVFTTSIVAVAWWERNAGKAGRAPWFTRDAAKGLLALGARMQVNTLATMLFDPVLKATIAAVGGAATLGMYELASKAVQQVRAVVTAPTQNLVPTFVASMNRPDALATVYEDWTAILLLAGLASMVGMVLISPALSFFWFGRLDWGFLGASTVLATAWFVNIVAMPGYFLGIARGYLRWNIAGALATTLVGPAAAALMSRNLGIAGAASGAAVGIAAGAALTAIMNAKGAGIGRQSLVGGPAFGRLRARLVRRRIGDQ